MQPQPTQNSEELLQNQDEYSYVPFDGFVNVNDIVTRRRQLRNAEFNVPEQTWEININMEHPSATL
ncbi:hypothetical protein HDE69_003733 [Pedobacter cryoconitis]|uniref:Uncharacterized protein n=1 Tax=Pedobacter cryoconitis TaxID=188932 RepID=A0A7W8YVP5_9SPHI|nr:hypothetical protein [Pedobacter cryoconitis]MBB5622655.1 hypothetical protein [Pedobacter cryoconitis]MBB5648808.1 hypothetical protein [Pedobacter cryoconitis]